MCSWWGNDTSAAKRPVPVSSGRSSSRRTERPTNFGFSAAMAGPSLRAQFLHRGPHRLDDVLIAGAAAKIGREHVDEVVVVDVRLAFQHSGDQHEEAGRAEAALQPMVLHEGALKDGELLARGQALDRADRLSGGLHREHQAGAHRRAVDQHRAGAAHAVLAADMGAGLAAILADRVHQGAPRLDANRMVAAVDRQHDVDLAAHARFSAARSAARMRCGVAGISLISAPNGERASLMALMTAAGAPMVPPSPTPLARVTVASLIVAR